MTWKDVATTVAKAAPLLGAALGGPVGAVAGAAGTVLASALGVEATPAAVLSRIKNPETYVQLKELEVREKSRILQWQQAHVEAELENTKNARMREVALAEAGHAGTWITGIVALVVVSGFFGMLFIVLQQKEVNEPALLLLGFLGTGFGSVVNYYLGSSLGSYRKDALMGRSAPTKTLLGGEVIR